MSRVTVEEIEGVPHIPDDVRANMPPQDCRSILVSGWQAKVEKVKTAIATRSHVSMLHRQSWSHTFVMPLLVGVIPKAKALRKHPKDALVEVLVRPSMLPTPRWRKWMHARFGPAICGPRRNTPNPNNPLAQSVDGWWWHGGFLLSGALPAMDLRLGRDNTGYLGDGTTVSRNVWSKWLVWRDLSIERGAPVDFAELEAAS